MAAEGNEDLHVERTCVCVGGVDERSTHELRGHPSAISLIARYGSDNLSSLPDHILTSTPERRAFVVLSTVYIFSCFVCFT